jgi:DNA-binding PadR family transcriptional regulator
MALRLSADWMVKADDRILEFLEAEGPHSPKRISEDDRMFFKKKHINMRLLKLAEVGLVEKDEIGRGIYSISESGKEYLAGNLDARDLPEPDS